MRGEFKAACSLDEMSSGSGFLQLVDLLAGKVPEIAVATHDYVLARESICRAQQAGSAVQLELLFGMPARKMMTLAKEMDVSVRFYVPYSDALFIYGVRQFLVNPHKLLRPDLLEVFATLKMKTARIISSI